MSDKLRYNTDLFNQTHSLVFAPFVVQVTATLVNRVYGTQKVNPIVNPAPCVKHDEIVACIAGESKNWQSLIELSVENPERIIEHRFWNQVLRSHLRRIQAGAPAIDKLERVLRVWDGYPQATEQEVFMNSVLPRNVTDLLNEYIALDKFGPVYRKLEQYNRDLMESQATRASTVSKPIRTQNNDDRSEETSLYPRLPKEPQESDNLDVSAVQPRAIKFDEQHLTQQPPTDPRLARRKPRSSNLTSSMVTSRTPSVSSESLSGLALVADTAEVPSSPRRKSWFSRKRSLHKHRDIEKPICVQTSGMQSLKGVLYFQSGRYTINQMKSIYETHKYRLDRAPLVVFGDNDKDKWRINKQSNPRSMSGGQAAAVGPFDWCFGLGIPTTFVNWPLLNNGDPYPSLAEFESLIEVEFTHIRNHLQRGSDVIIPVPNQDDLSGPLAHRYCEESKEYGIRRVYHNLGTGIADLPFDYLMAIEHAIRNLRNSSDVKTVAMFNPLTAGNPGRRSQRLLQSSFSPAQRRSPLKSSSSIKNRSLSHSPVRRRISSSMDENQASIVHDNSQPRRRRRRYRPNEEFMDSTSDDLENKVFTRESIFGSSSKTKKSNEDAKSDAAAAVVSPARGRSLSPRRRSPLYSSGRMNRRRRRPRGSSFMDDRRDDELDEYSFLSRKNARKMRSMRDKSEWFSMMKDRLMNSCSGLRKNVFVLLSLSLTMFALWSFLVNDYLFDAGSIVCLFIAAFVMLIAVVFDSRSVV